MKKFFEDYGKTIIIILIVLVLLFLVPQIGANVKENILATPMAESDTLFSLNELEEPKVIIEGTMAKGNIVIIDSKEYRVLSMSDTEAKLLAMYDTARMKYDASNNEITSFNGTDGIQYAGSDLDNYLENTFYPALSFKDAIIPQNITQNMYQRNGTPADASSWYNTGFTSTTTSGTNYTVAKTGSVSVGSRHVYVLDMEDVISYLGSSWTPQQLNTMLWNENHSLNSTYAWLRSAYAGGSSGAWSIFGDSGSLSNNHYSTSSRVRPAFVIDLTKCEYTK